MQVVVSSSPCLEVVKCPAVVALCVFRHDSLTRSHELFFGSVIKARHLWWRRVGLLVFFFVITKKCVKVLCGYSVQKELNAILSSYFTIFVLGRHSFMHHQTRQVSALAAIAHCFGFHCARRFRIHGTRAPTEL